MILYYYSSPPPADLSVESKDENIKYQTPLLSSSSALKISRLKEVFTHHHLDRQKIVMKSTTNYSLHPMDSLLDASRTLLSNKLHRLPLIDSSQEEGSSGGGQESLLFIMTQYNILAFLSAYIFSSPSTNGLPEVYL